MALLCFINILIRSFQHKDAVLSGYWDTHNLWITWSPKCGLTTMNHLYTDYRRSLNFKEYTNNNPKIVTIIRNPLERAISIYNYNMYRLPYASNTQQKRIREAEHNYNTMVTTIRNKFPDVSTLQYNENRFLFWLNEILPLAIKADGHSMAQNTSWKYPKNITKSKYWILEDLNRHLLKVFQYQPKRKYQNEGRYNKEIMLKLLDLPGVKEQLTEYYYDDTIIFNQAIHRRKYASVN